MSARLYGVPGPHEELVDMFVDAGFQTHGFRQTLELLAEHLEDLDAATALLRIVQRGRPDAWRLDLDARRLTIVEVEVGNPMTDDVLDRWTDLALYIDSDHEWELNIWRVDRWGTVTQLDWVAAFAYGVKRRQRERERVGGNGGRKSAH